MKYTILLLPLLLGCHNPTQPDSIVATCEPVYMPVITPSDTLWFKTSEVRCTWLNTRTGEGGAGRHP